MLIIITMSLEQTAKQKDLLEDSEQGESFVSRSFLSAPDTENTLQVPL